MRNIFLLILLVLFILPISISGAPATHSPASNNIHYEVRAAWLTTLMGLDWPSKPATTEAQAELQRRDLCRQLDQLKAAGINMVLFSHVYVLQLPMPLTSNHGTECLLAVLANAHFTIPYCLLSTNVISAAWNVMPGW